ncbi:hypothetical protein PR202_gb15717 [Eleusine coracana subsp. coracana]|uniref:Clp R domain-containing protein n=1 Tax=Eleusine coracana subsp. coracana TaxID=191504 RepID=A0AAV5EZW8_ELECO|nr:hypothetical protein PR202_gb15717 [Eleusine coracana subsp. coracana]
MRAGGCTVQQSLTADAATVVKQAVSLARRRGNAQVTPLHVASAMLAAPGGLLRAACLRSHSHPLQCKALELCFNVALNRLPASAAVRALLACAGAGCCWLVGFGTRQAFVKCKAGQPSLESLWGLQALTVPAGSLALSLTTCAFDDSALDTVNQSMKASPDTDGNGPTSCWPLLGGNPLLSRCCGDCSAARIDTKAALPRPFVSSSSLPSWLQHCRDQDTTHLTDLGKTWSSICSKPSQRMTLHFSAPVSPASSVSSYEHGHQLHQPRQSWLLADLDGKHPWKPKCETSGKSRSNDSGPSIGSVEVECRAKFKELNAENLKVLCGALEKEVPWHKEIVPEIASTVLQCRSGIAKRRDKSKSAVAKEETWMFFLGGDAEGKETVARELANLVFGSRNNLLSIRIGASCSPSRLGLLG